MPFGMNGGHSEFHLRIVTRLLKSILCEPSTTLFICFFLLLMRACPLSCLPRGRLFEVRRAADLIAHTVTWCRRGEAYVHTPPTRRLQRTD